MTKQKSKIDLVTGIILVETGEISEDNLISFVSEHKETLLQLQGSWVRLVQALEDGGLI
jgi:hypothetical protein